MKNIKSILPLLASLCCSSPLLAQEREVLINSDKEKFHLPIKIVEDKEIPQFYSAEIENAVSIEEKQYTQSVSLKITKLQGKSKRFSLKLSRNIKQATLTSTDVKDWAIREDAETKQQYLDIFPKNEKLKSLNVTFSYTEEKEEHNLKTYKVVSFAPVEGESSGFSEIVWINNQANASVRAIRQQGFNPVDTGNQRFTEKFITHTGGSLTLRTNHAKFFSGQQYIDRLKVDTVVSVDGKSADVRVSGVFVSHANKGGDAILFTGNAALTNYPSAQGLRARSEKINNEHCIYLSSKKAGEFPFDLNFVVPVEEVGGWKQLKFDLFDSAIVPINFRGLSNAVKEESFVFDKESNVVPTESAPYSSFVDEGPYTAFLPSEGGCNVRWKASSSDKESKLFYTTKSTVDVFLGGGMMRQTFNLQGNVLQGKLDKYTLKIDGEGDVMNVVGNHVSHWNVNQNKELVIHLTGSYEEVGVITVLAQHPLGSYPAKVNPMKLTPLNSERHNGFVRITNRGAVSIEVNGLSGMMQVAPEQYPNYRAEQQFDQVYTYRFPSNQRDWKVEVDQVLPELSVRHLLVYGVGLSDRSILAEINLEVKEAALREWQVLIPDGYVVSGINGASVSDYVLSNSVTDGMRGLKIQFTQPLLGTHLVKLKLEKNEPATEGTWKLPQIQYPGVDDVRGQIGVASALGWKISNEKLDQLSEIPLAYFQKNSAEVHQSYRQRKPDWEASVKIEKLSQSVAADMFHLYTIREGIVECEVVINYFVVGAPTNEWRLQIPEGVENLTVVGQNVRSHSREGEFVIVKLEQPTMGNVKLFVQYEHVLSSQGGEINFGQVTPLGVESESGYVQVVSPLQVNHHPVSVSENLIKLEEPELPAEWRLISSVPTVAAWQYSSRPFDIGLKIDWYTASEYINQSVDYATVETSLTKEGRAKTKAIFYVKSRGKQTLRMKLPVGSELWGVTANDERLNVRVDGSEYLVPLPARVDVNTPVKLEVNYGSVSEDKSLAKLGVPTLSAPIVVANWKVESEDGQYILPINGNVSGASPYRGQTGFSWAGKYVKYVAGILALLAAGSFMLGMKKKAVWKTCVGVVWLVLAALGAMKFIQKAKGTKGAYDTFFEVTAPMVNSNSEVILEVQQLSKFGAMISPLGLTFVFLGILSIVVGVLMKPLRKFMLPALGVVMLSIGLLMQYGGASWFFGLIFIIACLLLVVHLVPLVKGLSKPATTAAVLAVSCFFMVQNADAGVRTINETWQIKEERLQGKATIVLDSELGEKVRVLKAPATLTKFESETCNVTRGNTKDGSVWFVIPQSKGVHTVEIQFEMRVPKLAESNWNMVTGNSPVRSLKVELDRKGWEATSEQAVRVAHREEAGKSISDLTLLPQDVQLLIRPKKVDPDSLPLNYFVETGDLYLPAPGVLDGVHEVIVRPVSGRMREVSVVVPEGLMVGEVNGKEVNDWKFDPVSGVLHVQLSKPLADAFYFQINTQQALKEFPVKASLAPLRVKGASKVIGMFGIGFGGEAQPDLVKPSGMNIANIDDFKKSLISSARVLRPNLKINKVYRYGSDAAKLDIAINSVAPEMRVVSADNLYLGDERVVLNSQLEVNITRAGVFSIQFTLPEGYEVESVNGASLKEYTETQEGGNNLLNLNLKSKQLGKQYFKIALINNKPVWSATWEVPRLHLVDAIRQSSNLTIIPQQGIQVETVSRKNVTQEDAREIKKKHSGALAYRLLQKDSELKVKIQKLTARIKAEALQEVTIRDGQTRTRIGIAYQVDHAAVKDLLIRIPELKASAEKTVRASGAFVKSIEKLEGDLWRINLRRGMIGSFIIDLEYQVNTTREGGVEQITPIQLEDVKQHRHYVAVRANEQLDISPVSLSRAWRNSEWKSIDEKLYKITDASVPELSYQLMDKEAKLEIQVKRHAMADALKLRVESAEVHTIFSQQGDALNQVLLDVEVIEKGAMTAVLPSGSQLFGVQVNGASVSTVREGDMIRFNVAQILDNKKLANIKIVYANVGNESFTGSEVALFAPQFEVPIEVIKWKVVLPEGVKLDKVGGDFDKPVKVTEHQNFNTSAYMAMLEDTKSYQVRRASGLMREVQKLMTSGKDRDKTAEILNQVSQNKAVGRDMNEDAHNLLIKTQWQNALMGLSTRSQKMYLENKQEGNVFSSNSALEEAAGRNPLFRGQFDYNPNQVRDYMQGMGDEDRVALEQIARLLVSSNNYSVSAPQAMNVTIPEMGTLLEFERKIHLGQTDGLKLILSTGEVSSGGSGRTWIVILLIAIASFFTFRWKTKEA